jgi:hypothetical protein
MESLLRCQRCWRCGDGDGAGLFDIEYRSFVPVGADIGRRDDLRSIEGL